MKSASKPTAKSAPRPFPVKGQWHGTRIGAHRERVVGRPCKLEPIPEARQAGRGRRSRRVRRHRWVPA